MATRLPASQRTREELRSLIEGRLSTAAGKDELIKLATRLIVEEALEGETGDVVGRDYYAHCGFRRLRAVIPIDCGQRSERSRAPFRRSRAVCSGRRLDGFTLRPGCQVQDGWRPFFVGSRP